MQLIESIFNGAAAITVCEIYLWLKIRGIKKHYEDDWGEKTSSIYDAIHKAVTKEKMERLGWESQIERVIKYADQNYDKQICAMGDRIKFLEKNKYGTY